MSDILNYFEELDKLDEALSNNILYHRTSPKAAANILNDDILRIGGTYAFNAKHGQCVCFSRDYNFIKQMPGKNYVVFVFDRDKLTNKYKLEPINDNKNSAIPGGRFQRTSKAEEICFKNITNMQNYLLKIIINDEIFDDYISVLDKNNVNYNKDICIKASEYDVRNLD